MKLSEAPNTKEDKVIHLTDIIFNDILSTGTVLHINIIPT